MKRAGLVGLASPEPLGVIYRSKDRESYDALVHEQVEQTIERRGTGDLHALLNEGETWIVEEGG